MSTFDPIAAGRRVLQAEGQALHQMADELGDDFARAVEIVFAARGRVVCTGIGKSGHVARKIAATLASTGAPAMFVHAAEASHGDLGMIGPDDVILALSKSGEVRELSDVIAYSHRFGIPLLGMTANPDSALGKASTVVLKLADAPEATGEL
ncbi:MAG: SIS domain-containing protein, partial [Caulobacter sp.]|nr:SIS domain-containing protein [Caulobacter sp.]